VQKVREAAARMKCQNNLKQFGIAIHSYNDTYNRLPPSGDNWNDATGSWLVQTLPYMEQGNMYKQFNPATQTYPNSQSNNIYTNWQAANPGVSMDGNQGRLKLPYGLCPSDPGPPNADCVSYVGSMGPQCAPGNCGFDPNAGWCRPESSGLGGGQAGMGYTNSADHGNDVNPANIRGLFNRLGARITLLGITDGTSNTIAVGESLPSMHDHLQSGQWWGYNNGAAHCTTIVPINGPPTGPNGGCGSGQPIQRWDNWNMSWGFRSNHTNGTNFVFADGSTRFINQSIDMRTYQLMGCRNDGQAVNLP